VKTRQALVPIAHCSTAYLEAVVKLGDDYHGAPESGINLFKRVEPDRRAPFNAALLEEQNEAVGRGRE
jgi:hypothetical protein